MTVRPPAIYGALTHDDRVSTSPIGLGANVLHPAFANRPMDGIGVYTAALERALGEIGVITRRVYAPAFRSGSLLRVPAGELGFAEPVPSAILRNALSGTRIVGSARVESSIRIYHATDYLVPPLGRTPIVVTLYDAIPHSHPEWATPRLRNFKNWLRQRGIARADLILALSHSTVPDLEQHYGIDRGRIRVVHLGVDERWFSKADPAAVKAVLDRKGLHAGYLLFVGTLQPRKNIRGLLAAYDRLPRPVRAECQLVIVGRFGWGDRELCDELRQRTATARCLWLHDVSSEELHAIYAAASAFVFPSLAEGFGLPVLEALAAGVPVVASDIPVLREIGGSVVAFANPLDAEELAGAIVRVLSTDEAGAKNRRRFHARQFTWEATARGTAAAYNELS